MRRIVREAAIKAPPFEYHRPASLDEAVQVLAAYGRDAKVLAGGQSLLPLLAMRRVRPRHLVDLQRIPGLREVRRVDAQLRIGAMVRQREVEHDLGVPDLVRTVAGYVGNFEIRNRGTVGGSVAHLDPAAEWPALALALDAVFVAVSARGQREIRAADFIRGAYATALEPDEVLVEIMLPSVEKAFGFAEVARRGRGDFAIAGAVCHGTSVVVFGAGSQPQRLTTVEELLRRGNSEDVVGAAASEIEAVSEYRRRVAASLVGQVVAQAAART